MLDLLFALDLVERHMKDVFEPPEPAAGSDRPAAAAPGRRDGPGLVRLTLALARIGR
ncbi:MAG TPA: hypothetical protein VE777_11280 [Gaiellales bacterium]|jgi:hypothetical protein|nr:hypothetical protein [Gaiellales bacterium]